MHSAHMTTADVLGCAWVWQVSCQPKDPTWLLAPSTCADLGSLNPRVSLMYPVVRTPRCSADQALLCCLMRLQQALLSVSC
jgi:hypothetical protein